MQVNVPGLDAPVNFPDSMSPDEIAAAIQSDILPKVQQQNAAKNLPQTLNVGGLDTGIPLPKSIAAGIVGAGHGVETLIQGAQRGFNALTGNDQAQAELASNRQQAEQQYAPLEKAYPTATTVGDIAGQTLPFVAGGMGAGALIAKGAPEVAALIDAHPFYAAALSGAAQGGMAYPGQGHSSGGNAALGAAGGVVGQGLGSMIGKLASGPESALTDLQKSLLAKAQDAGFKLTPFQSTGNTSLGLLERVLSTTPFSSGMDTASRVANQGLGTAKALSTIGGTGEASAAPDVMAPLKQALSSTYEQLKAYPGTVTVDDELASKLSDIRAQEALKPAPDGPLMNVLNSLLGHQPRGIEAWSPAAQVQAQQAVIASSKYGGQLSTPAFQAVRSELSDIASKGGSVGNAAGNSAAALDDALGRSMPPDVAAQWTDVRQKWAALKTIEPAITPDGQVDTKKLFSIIKQRNPNQILYGESSNPQIQTLGNLATMAKGLPQPPSTSGTSELGFMRKLLTNPTSIGLETAGLLGGGSELAGGGPLLSGAAAIAPFLLPLLAGKGYYSKTAADWARQGIPGLQQLGNTTLGQVAGQLPPILGASMASRFGQ
jgi:hypothetical protein